MNLGKLQAYINKTMIHSAQCGGEIPISGEKRDRLAAIILTQCSKCGYVITLETSHKVVGGNATLQLCGAKCRLVGGTLSCLQQ